MQIHHIQWCNPERLGNPEMGWMSGMVDDCDEEKTIVLPTDPSDHHYHRYTDHHLGLAMRIHLPMRIIRICRIYAHICGAYVGSADIPQPHGQP